MKLSFVVPCFNEEGNVKKLLEEIKSTVSDKFDYEVVFVNDGSSDHTGEILKSMYEENKSLLQGITFSRNFGKEAAMYAGLKESRGDLVLIVDADLQQRPEIVRDMVAILENEPDYDVVAAYQDRRSEGKVLSFFKKSFYAIINKLSKVQLQPDASDFRTFRRKVAESILALPEYHRFSKGIFAWVGYNTCFIPYTACERAHGTTKWNFWKLLIYSIDGIIGFSTMPLAIASVAGVSFCIIAFLLMLFLSPVYPIRKMLLMDCSLVSDSRRSLQIRSLPGISDP